MRPLPIFLTLALLAGTGLAQAPAPKVDPAKPVVPAPSPAPVKPIAPPKAVITAPESVAAGDDIVLRADLSVGTRLSWQLISPKVPYEVGDFGGRAASRLIVPKAAAGTYKFALVSTGATPDVFDSVTAEVPVLAPAVPDVTPPTPAPPPAPVTPVVPAVDVTPKAVAVARGSYPSGSAVFVDATGSRSATPLQFQVLGRPNEPLFRSEGGMGVMFPALTDGHYFVAVTATAPRDYAGPPTNTAVVDFTIGAPPKPVTPDVPPAPVAPDPAPATPIQGLGKGYASADVLAMAATWEESATMLAAGNAVADITKTFGARWQARRTPAFVGVSNAFAAISPANAEPKDQATRDALGGAWHDFAAGLRLGVK